MKKVQLSLKRGSETASFTLYDSVESAYYLKDEPPYPDGFEEEYRKIITLKQGDILEVEWVGSEWIFDDGKNDFPRDCSVLFEKYDKVRIGKLLLSKGQKKNLDYSRYTQAGLSKGTFPGTRRQRLSVLR